jgi:hypothetical protein
MLRIFEKTKLVIAWIGLPDHQTTRNLSQTLEIIHKYSEDNTVGATLSQFMAGGSDLRHDLLCLEGASKIVKAARERDVSGGPTRGLIGGTPNSLRAHK